MKLGNKMELPTPANDNSAYWPRGLSRDQAATYIGVGTTLFDAMVRDGRMPVPKRMNTRTVWDRLALDRSFEKIDAETPNANANNWEFAA
jgi:hypothetical protein